MIWKLGDFGKYLSVNHHGGPYIPIPDAGRVWGCPAYNLRIGSKVLPR